MKFWYLDSETGMPIVRKDEAKKVQILQSESADLTKVKCQIFIGVSISKKNLVFVLGIDGHIYVFN